MLDVIKKYSEKLGGVEYEKASQNLNATDLLNAKERKKWKMPHAIIFVGGIIYGYSLVFHHYF